MANLACMSDSQWVDIGKIAQRQDVTKPFMAKIASQAAAAGVLTTQRGTGGGLALTQPAYKITLLQILEAIDSPMALNQCTFEPFSFFSTTDIKPECRRALPGDIGANLVLVPLPLQLRA